MLKSARLSVQLLLSVILISASPVMGNAMGQKVTFGTDLDGDGVENSLDPSEGELGVNRLSMYMKKRWRGASKIRVSVDGWLDAGILGPEGSLDRSDFSLSITGSEGDTLNKSIPAGACRMSKSGTLRCSTRGAKLKLKKIRGLSDSVQRYRVKATVYITDAESLPAHPLNILASFGDADWTGSISSATCVEKERRRSHKVKCDAAIGMEQVSAVMRPVLVLRGTDMETREIELSSGKTTLGGNPAFNDIAVLRQGVPTLSKEFEVSAAAVTVRHVNGANSEEEIEAVALSAGSPISLSEIDDVSATLVYRSILSDAEDIVEHDSNLAGNSEETAPSGRVRHVANVWSKIIAFGDSITAGYTYFPSGEMMPANYMAFAVCSPPNGWPNTQCSNNQPGAYTQAQLIAHFDESKKREAWGWLTGYFDTSGDYFKTAFVNHETAANRSSNHGSVEVMKRTMYNPFIAYPYRIQAMLRAGANEAKVYNYAMSGATPANWDPSCNGKNWVLNDQTERWHLTDSCSLGADGKRYPSGGLFATGCDMSGYPGGQDHAGDEVYVCGPKKDFSDDPAKRHTNWTPNWTVMHELESQEDSILWIGTLGANPLLRRWLHVYAGPTDKRGANVKTDHCVSSESAAEACMNADLATYEQEEHIVNSLTFLLSRGDVAIMKYYHSCPGLFGYYALMNTTPTNSGSCTAYQQRLAFRLSDMINETIHRAVVRARDSANPLHEAPSGFKIIEVCPGNMPMSATGKCEGGFWDSHGAWKNLNDGSVWGNTIIVGPDADEALNNRAWTTWNDSGMHPNPTGHEVLAQGAIAAICEQMGHYCEIEKSLTPDPTEVNVDLDAIEHHTGSVVWAHGDTDQQCVGSHECAFMSIMNATNEPLILNKSYYAHNGPTGYSSSNNEGRDAGDGKFVQFPLWRIEPNRTATVMAQNHDEWTLGGPTIQLEYEAGGGYLVFNVNSESTGGGVVAAYSSSPMYKLEDLGTAKEHNTGVVGNWKVSPRAEGGNQSDINSRFVSAQWDLNPTYGHNEKWCEAAMQDGGSKYAAYYSISNKGPDTLHLDHSGTSLDHGAWCVKPAKTVPAGHSTIAVIGDSGTALSGVKGNIRWTFGAHQDHHINTLFSSLDSKQGTYDTSQSSGAAHGYYRVKEANMCTFGVVSEAVTSCVDTSTTVVNLWVDTDTSVHQIGPDAYDMVGGAVGVGERCGTVGGEDSDDGVVGTGKYQHAECTGDNTQCGREWETMGPNSMHGYTTYTNECTGFDSDNDFTLYLCQCHCAEGMTLVGGECRYPDCTLPCSIVAPGWGRVDEARHTMESSKAVCYTETGAHAGQCSRPLALSEGTLVCSKDESPRGSLCKPITASAE